MCVPKEWADTLICPYQGFDRSQCILAWTRSYLDGLKTMAFSIHDIAIGAYVPGYSVLHRLDPRTKLIAAAVLLIAIFAASQPLAVLIHAAIVALLAVMTAAGWRVWLWGLSRFTWMLVIVAGTGLFFHPGGQVVVVWERELPFTVESLAASSLFTAQVAEAIVVSLTLTVTTTPTQLTRGLERLFRPLRIVGVPVEEVALVLLLAMRFVPLLQQETRTIIEAQRSRGVEFSRGNLIIRCRNLMAVFVPALVSTLKRADILALAMTCRGFQPGKPRSEYRPLRLASSDYWAWSFLLLLVVWDILL
jgi:energy-coupling factor transport system permease protein